MPSAPRFQPLLPIAVLVIGVAAHGAAQELLPAVNFRNVTTAAGENWPGDFNADGITDLVSRRTTTGAIQVALGNGDGTFRTPIVSASIGWALGTGDLNGDGALDAVAQVGANVVVLPGNRTGALGAPRTVLGAAAEFALVADMNNDGRRDLVVGEQGYSLHIVAGNGDLTFRAPVTLETAAWPHGAIAVDVNADGRRDVVVAHRYDRRLIVFRNDGGLAFTPIEIPVDRSTTDVTARDLDGDSRIDLVVSARGPGDDGPFENGFVYIYRGNGDGTFGGPSVFETAPGAHSVVVGDFTHDGRIDVATANHTFWFVDTMCGPSNTGVDSLTILPGTGAMSFGPATTFALWSQAYVPNEDAPYAVVRSLNTADVNRDRFPDLLPGWGRVLVTAAPRANRPPVASAGPDQTIFGEFEANVHGGGTDPDGHFLTFAWSDGGAGGWFTGGAARQAADNCYRADAYGTVTVRLTANDSHGGTASDAAVLTFRPTPDPPSVLPLAPAAGEVVALGVPYTIRWEASDPDGIREFDIFSSVDDGRTWQPIAECTNLAGALRQCTWNSPGPAVEALARILVRATDTFGVIAAEAGGRFSIRASSPGALPSGWVHTDVGAVGAAGSATLASGVFTVRGSGADIWGAADEFHWAYTARSGDLDFTARVASVQNVNQWTKAGLMIRASNAANAVHASLFATPTTVKGVAFQRRRLEGGSSVGTPGPLVVPPVWLRLSLRGSMVIASYRRTITDPWTRIGVDTIPYDTPVYVGLAVSSHVDGTLATARFDNVRINAVPRFTYADIGAVGLAGRMSSNSVQTTVEASGGDIWGTADAFGYVYARWTGDGTITARVLSVENTHAWAKAGVMFRESLAANSKQVMTIVSAGHGVALQYRAATGGISASPGPRAGTAPEWVRLTRTGNTFAGATSNDGVTWTTVGSVTVAMPSTIYVGLPVTSHNTAALATAVFDDVSIRR